MLLREYLKKAWDGAKDLEGALEGMAAIEREEHLSIHLDMAEDEEDDTPTLRTAAWFGYLRVHMLRKLALPLERGEGDKWAAVDAPEDYEVFGVGA